MPGESTCRSHLASLLVFLNGPQVGLEDREASLGFNNSVVGNPRELKDGDRPQGASYGVFSQ